LGGFGEYGFDNFLSVINETSSENAEFLYYKEAIPDLNKRLAGNLYSDIFVFQASEELIKKLKDQLGGRLTIYRQEDNAFYSVILWKIAL
jgi:hypothetical protein